MMLLKTPMECTMPDGTVVPFDNALGGLPFLSDVGKPDNCVDGPSIASQAVDGVFGPDSFKQAIAGFVRTISTFWVNEPSPKVVNSDYQLTGTASFIASNTTYYTMVLLVIVVALVGAKIAWQQRAGGWEQIIGALLPFMIVTGFGAAIVATLLEVGDAYSPWIIERAASGGFADNLNAYLVAPDSTNLIGNSGAIILLALAAGASVIQMVIMLGKGGALVIMVGLWPLTSAGAGLEQGKAVLTGYTVWMAAFVLYTPSAATVYAGAFALMGAPPADADPVRTILSGVVIMTLAILTLPALLKILSPLAAPASGSNAGGWFMGAGAAATALARH